MLDQFLPVHSVHSAARLTAASIREHVWAIRFRVRPADVPKARALMAIRTLPTGLRSATSIMDSSLLLAELIHRDQPWVAPGGEPGRSLVAGRVVSFSQHTPELSGCVTPSLQDVPRARSAKREGFPHETCHECTHRLAVAHS